MTKMDDINNLLTLRADLKSRLNLLPYDGTVEVKEKDGKKYLYVRKRINGKITSKYIGLYDENILASLFKSTKETRELKKQLRHIEKDLALLGYSDYELDSKVLLNIEFARTNMKQMIYDQAILEGIGTTFPDTEAIIDNGKIYNVDASGVQKILNLKHAWEFILDKDVIKSKCDYNLSSYIAKLVNEGFYQDGGRIRILPVTIGGSTYIPPIPIEIDVKESIDRIVNSDLKDEDKAVELCLFIMKTQVYNDGNKRAAVIFSNFFLISKGVGLLIIPFNKVPEFKKKLVKYYDGSDEISAKEFLKGCILSF